MSTLNGRGRPVELYGSDGEPIGTSSKPLYAQLSTTPDINIGDVELLGDDGTVIAGSKTDAAATATDTTAVTWTSLWKQISKSVQAIAASLTGTLSVSSGASAAGGYSYTHIAAGQATTVIKASAGTLHSITLNSAATAANVTTIYDNATGVGTVIAIPAVTTATVPTTLVFDLAFTLGLTIVTTTANGGSMTVTYK